MSHLFSQWSYWGPLSDWTVDSKLLNRHNTPGELYMTGMDDSNRARLTVNVHVAGDNSTSLSYVRLSFHAGGTVKSVTEADLDHAMTFSIVTQYKCIPLVTIP